MTTAYTSLLGLALPVTGELSGTWGDTVNNSITSLLDTSVAGTTNVSTDADVTLTTTTGAANTARQAILLFSGARTALRTVTAPAQSKIYTVINATTGGFSVKLVGAGPTTGVTIVAGESAVCAWNGSDFIKISNTGGSASFTNVTVTGTTTLSGLTASTALALDASKNVVSVTNTGTGNNVLSASPTLTGTVAGASLTLSSLTSGRVTFAGASGLLSDSASLTWDGTTLSSTQVNITGQGTLRLQDTTGGEYVGLRSPSALGASYTLTFPADDGTSGQALITDGSGVLSWSTAASGDVYGPASATANGIALFDGTTGKLLKDSASTDGLIDGLTVGRGAGAVASNTAVGASALAANTTGDLSVAIGQQALRLNTTGSRNTAVGVLSLGANTTGTKNVAFGQLTLEVATTAAENTALGYGALNATTTGQFNTAVGSTALVSNTTASNNTAVGYQAGYSNTTGARNAFFGYAAGYSNTTAFANSAFGDSALYSNTTGQGNNAFGYFALYANTTGVANTAIGGEQYGVVDAAMRSNTTGSYNTAVGVSALKSNTTASQSTAVGYQAAYTSDAANNTAVGYQSLYANTTGNNTAIGFRAGYSQTTGSFNVFVGYQAALNATDVDNATITGYGAVGTGVATGTYVSVYGTSAAAALTSGSYIDAFGVLALNSNTTGSYNTALGTQALQANTTASYNTAVGYQAGYSNTTSTNLVAMGSQAGYNSTAANNTFLGAGAGYGTTSGGGNTCVGAVAGYALTTGQGNTFIGGAINGVTDASGRFITTGSKNSILGCFSGNQGGLDIRTLDGWIILSDGDGNFRYYFDPTNGHYMTNMGASAGSNALRYNTGNNRITYDTSSARYKNNIRDSVYGLSHVMQMRSAQFEYKDDGRSDVGLIAEELDPIIPELVGKNKDGQPDSVSYDRMVSVLVKAIQELKTEFDAYKATHP